jgi:hypothetical protein
MKALACTLVVIVAMVWPSAAAVALDITFDDVISVGNPLVTMLDTHGYRFTGSFRTIDAPGATLASNGSAVYLGQEASGPGIIVTRSDGGPFILYEFAAAGLHVLPSPGLPDAQQVKVVGLRIGGGLLSMTYELSTLPSFVDFLVPSTWTDLQTVTFTGLLFTATPGALALNDVGVGEGPTSVPEPGTLALAVITALGACAVALRRHRSHSFRHR